jgi:CheY-like chemotaxis protein
MTARILLVDDDEALRSALAKALTRTGYVTVEATNGQEALEAYRASPADLVLTDVYMPGTDGVEAIIRLRAEFPDARVIVMSGGGYMAAEGVLDVAMRLGAQGTLEKPVDIRALLQAIRDVLSR